MRLWRSRRPCRSGRRDDRHQHILSLLTSRRNAIIRLAQLALAAVAGLFHVVDAMAAAFAPTQSTADGNWSTPVNWSAATGAPAANDAVSFNNVSNTD